MPSRKSSSHADSGSPSAGEPVYLAIGHLRRPHGVRGEIVMEVHTDFPERIKPGMKVFAGESHDAMVIDGARFHNEGLIIKFRGVETPEDAGRYRNLWVYVASADRPPLPEGQYYFHELIGLQVVDDRDELLGELTEIVETGANNVYVVTRADGSEILLPAIPSVILDVEMGRRLMRVHLLEGL
ncbi:MAG: 16S rRNA processing protein RimM [Chloroflexi bacterium]|nr:16S rRNA processing protein RimM [Chloroflexota bacterium]